jgi:hypothetical protein
VKREMELRGDETQLGSGKMSREGAKGAKKELP